MSEKKTVAELVRRARCGWRRPHRTNANAAATQAIPDRLRHRPTAGGLPVPYVVALRPGGKAGFSFNSIDKVLEVARRRLCGQCGQPLDYYVAFIGSPEFCAHRFFGEPGMHEDCARYALSACPHLANNRVRGLQNIPKGARVLQHGSEGKPAPDTWALYVTRHYTVVRTRNGVPGFKVAPPIRVHWFHGGVEVPARNTVDIEACEGVAANNSTINRGKPAAVRTANG
jgi:hypothetical protein